MSEFLISGPLLYCCILLFARLFFALPQVDSKTHPVAPQSKMPEVFAQLDSKITHMMKAVSAALVKDDRGGPAAGDSAAGGSGGSGGGGGGGDPSPSKDMVRRTHVIKP